MQADWENKVTRRRVQHVYVETEQTFKECNKVPLTNALITRKWWSSAKMEVFCASSGLPPLVDRGDRLIWSAREKAPNGVEIVFRNHILMPLAQSPFDCFPVQLYSYFDSRSGMILTEYFHSFTSRSLES